ncbi:MAG: type II secretion system F family protein, partial [Myxococcales bacterium]|nr:type II secretion system F family protein [Myxococcales bacterium]
PVRIMSVAVQRMPIHDLRKSVGEQLRLSGDWLGLNPNEFIALSIVCGLLSIIPALALASLAPQYGVHTVVGLFALAVVLPYSKLTEESDMRVKHVHRTLPAAVELMSLCMGAGMDFPGSIRQIIDTAPDRSAPLYDEFARILQELDLGRTRKQALLSFQDRVPTAHVQDFVSAVVQAEEKGNPLARVLRIQANLQRARRSSEIEENAGKAAVKLMFPSGLLLVCCLILILGPVGLDKGFSGRF